MSANSTKVLKSTVKSYKSGKLFTKMIFTIIMYAITLTTIFPFIWMVSASFKKAPDVFAVPFRLIPDYLYFDNYIEVWTGKYDYVLMYWNSIKVTGISLVLVLITSCLAGYGFSRLKFIGRDAVFVIYLATMMVPPQLVLVPKFIMFTEIHLYNTHLALILPSAFSIFGVFMMRQYMSQIPFSLSESARIDGAGDLRICMQIIVPLCKPAILTLLILFFTWNWNDYEKPLIFLVDKKLYTVPLGLTNFMDETGFKFELIMAASTLSILPIFAVFFTAQKYFIGGVTEGAVKG